jgi:NADP-dependent 3-hydroxy acid dehydrogenase YdfG
VTHHEQPDEAEAHDVSDTVVITGASAGVGRATARAFAREGASLALLARDSEGLDAAVKEVEAVGGVAIAIPLDVADADAVDRAADAVEAEFGPIDVWVNNAMVSVFSPVHELTADEIRRVTEVTYLGSVYGTLSALQRMRSRNSGTIVQVSSALAHRSIPLQAAYCGAKHAIEGFVDSLRCELLHDHSGVRVTRVLLPAVNTPQFGWVRTRLPGYPQPVPPIYQPEVAAEAIVWATTHAPRNLKVGISTVAAIYANRLMPGLLDRYLALTAYGSQQLDEPIDTNRLDNLFSPVGGDAGAHGRFDARAHWHSWQFTARTALGNALGSVATITGRGQKRRSTRSAGSVADAAADLEEKT